MQVIAYACVACLLSMNIFLVFIISFFVLQSASAVFPACQHGFVGCCLADSLPSSTLKKIHKFYCAGEKRLALIEDEDAAMQNVLREDTGEDLAKESDDNVSLLDRHRKHCTFRYCEQTEEYCSDRKIYISFADSVGEILRQKMIKASSTVPVASEKISGDNSKN